MAGDTLEQSIHLRQPGRGVPLSPWNSPQPKPVLTSHQVDLWRFRLDPPPESIARMQGVLSRDEQARAARLLDARKSRQFVVARASLRRILALYLEEAAESLEFACGEHGKPRLGGALQERLRFNMAHAGDWGVVAVASHSELGVDMEQQDRSCAHDEIARHYFSPGEQALWARVPPARRQRSFYRIWTRKEALLKGLGGGFATTLPVQCPDGWQIRPFVVAPGFLGALAVSTEITRVQRWSLPSSF